MQRFISLFFVFAITLGCKAQFVITDKITRNTAINKGISYIEDKDGSLNISTVLKSKNFVPVTKDVPNFDVTASTYWLKVEIKNNTPEESFCLQVAQPSLDEIDFYDFDENGNIQIQEGGEHKPFSSRQFYAPDYIYHFHIDSNSTKTVFFRVKARDNLQVPISIGTEASILEAGRVKDFVIGIFAGLMVVMFLYNAFLYITVRDKLYLYYIVYLATVIFTQIGIQGYTFQYLWPNSPLMAQWSPFIFSPLVAVASSYFMREFLNTAQYCPKMDKGFIYFTSAYVVALIFSAIGKFDIGYTLINTCAPSLSIYMMICAIIVYRKNYRAARFFLVAWTLFLSGVIIYAMTIFGLLPHNYYTFYTMPVGVASEVVLLSFALADRINILKKEKEESQAEALRMSEENHQLVAEQNVVLEKKVHERTQELEDANEELNVTLRYLKDTQSQLVNSEKMASLGQLTAGIAHEINNPINFVSANLKPLKRDVSDVLEVINKYETVSPDGSDAEAKLKEIEQFKKQIDLNYTRKEIETLLAGIEEGARRTAEIVLGLRKFSRLDEGDIKEVNINEGIESTLILLRSTVPLNVKIETHLEPTPPIECYPGKINQVFMNVISNAIYAVNKKGGEGKVRISSHSKHDKVYVVFEDTGIGMSEEVKEKIFDPFFTTKDVGEGTGLGMSIVFKIVESHHAKMEINSELGKGTKITLILNKKMTGK